MGKINYKEESQRLDKYVPGESSVFWKPLPGKHKVKGLSEIEDAEPFTEEGKEPKAQVKIKLALLDKKQDNEVTWTIAVGATNASTYGQLIKLANERNGSLVNQEFTVVVVSDGKKNKYTIV